MATLHDVAMALGRINGQRRAPALRGITVDPDGPWITFEGRCGRSLRFRAHRGPGCALTFGPARTTKDRKAHARAIVAYAADFFAGYTSATALPGPNARKWAQTRAQRY